MMMHSQALFLDAEGGVKCPELSLPCPWEHARTHLMRVIGRLLASKPFPAILPVSL
jgi:hypothetical protein